MYGYYPSPDKCILVVRPENLDIANTYFKGTGITISLDGSKDTGVEVNSRGTRHLGAAVGTPDFKNDFINKKIANWIDEVKKLAVIAETEPHAAFCLYARPSMPIDVLIPQDAWNIRELPIP